LKIIDVGIFLFLFH